MKTISLQYKKGGYDLWDLISVLMATLLAKATVMTFLILTGLTKNPDGTFSDFLTILILTLALRPLSPRSKALITGFSCYFLATLIWDNVSPFKIDYLSIVLFIKVALSFFLYGLGVLLTHPFKKTTS